MDHLGVLVARASSSRFARSIAAACGILLAVAALGWFVAIAPAAVSFALAVAAAAAWCAWLEKHPDAPVDAEASAQVIVTSARRGGLSVYVLATAHDGTTCALTMAKHLTSDLDARIVLLVPRLASFSSRFDPTSQGQAALVDAHQALAVEVGVRVTVLLCECRRHEDLIPVLDRSSLLIVGGRTRLWWPSREERLVERLRSEGYAVVFSQVGAERAGARPFATVA